jgi:hypothetical protein
MPAISRARELPTLNAHRLEPTGGVEVAAYNVSAKSARPSHNR